ncbi:hypothetical protein [Myroides odoratus]|uniref:Uncharacterized protein n=1 Tax=Myroides odoratus TaxID=256 RepID=A0A378RIY3_MYROD|nr:hypothetical protein [Myroides odoratus]QQU02117.1 hypothetical protein I6I89_09555 [Myroides odoratus]STZ26982.1 Uncharacterised protein [Myroides odoratus]
MDAYQKLFTHIDKDLFFKSSVEDIIFIEDELIEKSWDELKFKVQNNEKVSIRGYGREAKGTNLYKSLYSHLLKNYNVVKDATNNSTPTRLLKELTPYSKTTLKGKTKILNYQVSHLFGRTKNPFLFNCPWNLAYVPKYLDPFTGHETQGEYSQEFKDYIAPILTSRFEKYIADYNNIAETLILPNLGEAFYCVRKELEIDDKKFDRFVKDATNELGVI